MNDKIICQLCQKEIQPIDRAVWARLKPEAKPYLDKRKCNYLRVCGFCNELIKRLRND